MQRRERAAPLVERHHVLARLEQREDALGLQLDGAPAVALAVAAGHRHFDQFDGIRTAQAARVVVAGGLHPGAHPRAHRNHAQPHVGLDLRPEAAP